MKNLFFILGRDGSKECFFEFNNLDQSIKRANLWVYIKPNPRRFNTRTVQIILTNKHSENKASNTSSVYSLKVSSKRGHWKNVDITNFLNNMLFTFHPNQKLFVSTTHRDVIVWTDDNSVVFVRIS